MKSKHSGYRGRTALITGASSGIGEEFARILAEEYGMNLILVARREERLQALARELRPAGVTVACYSADLSTREEAVRLVETLREQSMEIDYLINNAGFGRQGLYLDIEEETETAMIRLNMESLTYLTRAFLPGLMARADRAGRADRAEVHRPSTMSAIMNVASTAAFFPGPYMTVYYATKAYVLSYSEGLAEELRGTGIGVTALCPGPTRSEFEERAGMKGKGLFAGRVPTAREVARYGIEAMLKGKTVAVQGLSNKFAVFFGSRLAPRRMVRRLVARIQNF